MLIPMTVQEQIAGKIKESRRWRKLSQAELAELVGTSQTAIARLEHAEGNPTADLIQRVSTALDLDLDIHVRPRH